MARARAGRGLGFCEAPQSLVGEIHLNYGEVCALFNEAGPDPEEMLAGFVFHNLAMFPQSYPRPDLTHLPPDKVYECGELWALAPGAARLVRHAGYILAGLRGAQAIIAYALLKPRDTSALYKTFTRVGPPIEWQYVRGIDGSPAWTQAMVLQGAALEMTVNVATALSFERFDGQNLQFRNVFPIVPRIGKRIPMHAPSIQEVEIRSNRVVQLRR